MTIDTATILLSMLIAQNQDKTWRQVISKILNVDYVRVVESRYDTDYDLLIPESEIYVDDCGVRINHPLCFMYLIGIYFHDSIFEGIRIVALDKFISIEQLLNVISLEDKI